jgi:hypothetical protein
MLAQVTHPSMSQLKLQLCLLVDIRNPSRQRRQVVEVAQSLQLEMEQMGTQRFDETL